MCGGKDIIKQRTYLKYWNGAETFYSYDPQRRRLQNLVVNAKAGTIMDNAYSYDAVSNVLGVKNNAPLPQSGKAGGQISHSYTYDPLYRLSSATGTYRERTIRRLLTPLQWATTTCTASRARSSSSRKETCSSTARSTQATTSPTPISTLRGISSNSTMYVTSITARKKCQRTARPSTMGTSTSTMPTAFITCGNQWSER